MATGITTQPAHSTTVLALDNVTLSCSASVVDVEYSWHRFGNHLPTKSMVDNSGTLTIQEATPYDEGLYYCMASKNGVVVTSHKAVVQIDGKVLYNSLVTNYNANVHI